MYNYSCSVHKEIMPMRKNNIISTGWEEARKKKSFRLGKEEEDEEEKGRDKEWERKRKRKR